MQAYCAKSGAPFQTLYGIPVQMRVAGTSQVHTAGSIAEIRDKIIPSTTRPHFKL
jgi:hypothetical protein